MRKFFVAVSLLIGLYGINCSAADTQLRQVIDGAEYEDILLRLEAFHKTVTTLSAQFKQVKIIVPFNDTEEATGSFKLQKPDKFTWEFVSPERQKVLVKDNNGYVINPELQQVQIFLVEEDNYITYLLAGISTPISEYYVDFNITCFRGTDAEQPVYRYEMIPKKEDLKNYIQKCELTFSEESLLPVSAKLIEASGDITLITFSGMVVGQPIDETVFSVVIPPDYEVLDYRQ